MSVRTALAALLLTSACSPPDPEPPDAMPDAPDIQRTQVLTYKAIANSDLDLLFVIDDSPSMLDKQASLKAAFPMLVAQLSSVTGGVPNLHLGVVSSDMGTKGSAVTAFGGPIGQLGNGGCSMTGKNGALQIGSAALMNGDKFLKLDRSGTKNFAGTLEDTFSAMASLGAGGCGFEQDLHAMRRSLEAGVNPTFLRDSANLAVVVLTDEDDCSLLDPAVLGNDQVTFGPLQSFRCFRFGVECSPDTVNDVGVKTGCKPRATSTFIEDTAPFKTALLAAKGNDPRKVSFGVFAGTSALPIEVELRDPPGGGTPMTALKHSCEYPVNAGNAVADPPIRLQALAAAIGANGTVTSVCSNDLTPAAIEIGQGIKRLIGDACLTRAVAAETCLVVETRDSAPSAPTRIQPCADGGAALCYDIVGDVTCTTGPHKRLAITRSDAPAADAWITMSCAQ
ncbi:MAG: hypothetical protein ABI175_21215 [Polyangiales bacterium]